MADQARTVLHVCPDREVAGSRRRVVTAIGYDVVWVQSESAALFEISMGRCGILLLCHLLPKAVRASLTDTSTLNVPILISWQSWVMKPNPIRRGRMRASSIRPTTPDWRPCCGSAWPRSVLHRQAALLSRAGLRSLLPERPRNPAYAETVRRTGLRHEEVRTAPQLAII